MTSSIAVVSVLGSVWPALADQTLEQRARPYLVSALAAGNAFVSVSAASGMPNLAAESLATIFGPNLAPRTATGTASYPTTLGGISLHVVDSAGVDRPAQLLYVSPAQINYIVPAGTATGTAGVNIVNQSGGMLRGAAQIQKTAPGLFTANANGEGVVAATAYSTVIPTTMTYPVEVFECGSAPGSCFSVPIDPGVDRPVSVVLYATGLRGRSSDSAVKVTIGGTQVAVVSIGSFDSSDRFAGIDQVTITGLLNLRGSGEVDIVISADGATSNTGRINIL
jgi:uncharacterized protein (TIGR03437 family)